MTKDITIQAAPRTVVGKQVRALRRQGLVPGTIYGPGVQPLNIQLNGHDLERSLLRISGTQIITLNVDGQQVKAITREIQRHPIRRSVRHIDFYAVNMATRMTAEVSLHFTGHSIAVQRGDAVLLHGLNAVEVDCLPADLPTVIEVDLDRLKTLDDAIHVRDLALPPGVHLRSNPDEVVLRLTTVAAEVEEEQVAPVSAEVQIISRRPAEEEG